MKIHDCVQGTPEWLLVRAGIPTASQFHRIVTPTGKRSKQGESYMRELIAERILGKPLVGYVSFAMERGSELEAEAVAYYEFQRECETFPIGFITNDDETAGASPDRGVKDGDGLLEVKSPDVSTHMSFLLKHGSPYADYKCQVQGCIWIAEKDWEDVLSYYPGLPKALARANRDEEFIGKLSDGVREFNDELEILHREAISLGIVGELQERSQVADFSRAALLKALKDSLIQVNGGAA